MSSLDKKIAAIAGATGLVGKALQQKLLNGSEFDEVWSIGRRSSGIFHPKLKEWLIWAEDESFEEPDRLDTLFCCLGTTLKKAGSKSEFFRVDHDLVLEFAKLGLKKGADSYILISSKGADSDSLFFYNRVKGKVESDLKLLKYKRLAYFRPSILAGPRHENRFGEKLGLALMRMLTPLIPGSDRFKPTDSEILAKAMLNLSQTDFESPKVIESIDIPRIADVE